jgi:hypothetical protein
MFTAILVCVGILSAIATGCGGGGGVDRPLDTTFETPTHAAVDAADVDADGLMDLVSVSYLLDPQRSEVNVFLQQGAGEGNFAPKVTYRVADNAGMRVSRIALADLNLDAAVDIVVSHYGRIDLSGELVSVLLQDPQNNGVFQAPRTYLVGSKPQEIVISDLDFDGLPDIATATSEGVYLLRQNGVATGEFLAAMALSTTNSGTVASGDLNGDGFPDLIFDDGEGLTMLLNDPSNLGTFLPGRSIEQPYFPADVSLSDLNADGRLDVITALGQATADPDRGSVVVTLQDAAGAAVFGVQAEYLVADANSVESVDVRDLNGDGRPDIAAAVSGTQASKARVALLLQASGPAFDFGAPTYLTHDGVNDPWMAIVAQLGPDTAPDLVLANGGDGIYIYYQDNAGGGVFGAATVIGK